MTWIKSTDCPPPKDRPFLCKYEYGYAVVKWVPPPRNREYEGWFVMHGYCHCCAGHCSIDPDEWMEIPE